MKVRNKKKIDWKILILSFIIVIIVAGLGGIFTSGNTNSDWYQNIKPSITPPNYVFPIVWNILFFLIALSLYFALVNSRGRERKIFWNFGINFILNVLWSFLFFYLQNPVLGLVDIILIWFSILSMIFATWRVSKISSSLLIPYFLWVSFASLLNYLIVVGK